MSTAAEVMMLIGGAITAVGIILGGVWWLVRPRVDDYLAHVVSRVDKVAEQLDETHPGSAAANAKQAADAAPAITEMAAEVHRLAVNQRDLLAWRARMEGRVGNVESALLAILGPELRRQLAQGLEPAPQHHHVHIDQDKDDSP